MLANMTRVGAFLFLIRCIGPDETGAKRFKITRQIARGRVDWPRVVAIASEHWMTLALYHELAEKGLLDALPPDLIEYFEFLHQANRSRNEAILRDAGEIAGLLNEIGVVPLLLKGGCHLVSGLYPDPAIRFLYDLDILVPDERALECWQRLVAAGYRIARQDLSAENLADDHWPELVREGRMAEVEVHRVAEWRPPLGSPGLYTNQAPVTLPGGKASIPDPTCRVIFALAHGFVHHRERFKAQAHLRDLYDATWLLRRHGAEIDWGRVIDAFESAGETEALRQGLGMWRRLFVPNPPLEIESSLAASLYWPRCLLEVARPQIAKICELVAQNASLLTGALARTPRGRELRRALRQPSVLLRKARFAARTWAGAPGDK
jgi:hypothetical protein